MFFKFDQFWMKIWIQGLKLSGENTTYYQFGQKQRFYERKPKNGHLNIDKMDKSQYTEKFP